MIVRKHADGSLTLIGQTDHSRLVGQLAAHWGNDDFAPIQPFEAVARAATYHDYGWLSYETEPLINPENGEPYEFRQMPFNPQQLANYQWCVDWLAGLDPYSGLLVSMHRTGLWKQRYETIGHPAARFNPIATRPEIHEFITRHEAWQDQTRAALPDDSTVATNYQLLQVWDLLGLYFCCQEPCEDFIEPVPQSYAGDGAGVRMTMAPVGDRQVRFDPYPFDVRGLRVTIDSKRLPRTSYADTADFRQAYYQAENQLLEYELV